MRILIVLSTALLLCGACADQPATTFDDRSAITMEKTVCFGFCPVYTIHIQGDGQARLEGVQNFDKIGTYRKQLSAEETATLFDAFLAADFWSFKDEYTAQVTDLPTTYLTFENQGRTKKVTDYYEPPQALVELEERVARIATADGWEKTGASKVPAVPASLSERSPVQQIEYGQHLVEVMGCHDCHSPKVMTEQGPAPDPARLLSGHPATEKLAPIADREILKNYALFNTSLTAAVGPWGTSFAANLTPDESGLGNWTIDNFSKALREGKAKGQDNGRMLLPPMPWPNFHNLSDEELKGIWSYLQSIPPIKNVVPPPVPPASQVG